MKKLFTFIIFVLFTGQFILAQTTINVGEGTAVLDGNISSGEWNNTAITTQLGVKLNAMADGQYLYVLAQWADTTESVAKKRWTFDGTSWSQSGNEDRLGIIWDMGLNGTEGASCATMCHGDGLMYTNGGKADEWHWKAARSNALGYVDDKYVDSTNQHGDDGLSSYSNNSDNGSGQPSFMAYGDAGVNAEFLLSDADAITGYDPYGTVSNHVAKLAVPFDPNAGWTAGDHVAGYILRVPQGDRSSVQSAGKWENGVWTVEFRKPYTGSNDDFEVAPGGEVKFTYEIFDNQGGSHPNDGFDAALYTLDFSNIPGTRTTLVVGTGEAILDGFISPGEYTSSTLETALGVKLNAVADGQYLYVVAQWSDATESVAKKRWTYNGTSWAQSGNEDRLGIIWDMGQNGTDGASCATMCHGDGLMYTNGGKADEWHWKAARSNALGYVDDKYVDATNQHGDDGQSSYSDNPDNGSGQPTFMAVGDPSANVDFLLKDADALNAYNPFGTVNETSDIAIPFDPNASWSTDNHVPGYVLRIPQGDRASVQSAGRYENGMWTVEFRKPYAGTDDDFEVVPGSSVEFSHETFDNQGGTHPNDGFDATVYTLDFSNIPSGKTTLVVTQGAANLDGVITAGEYTSSTLETALGVKIRAMADGEFLYLATQWVDTTYSVAKHRWTYDGSTWTQSGNEDRIGFNWDMGQNGTDGANCTTMCHGDGLMRTNGGVVDQWHWKAARSNPMGYADDKFVDAANQNGDPGLSAYSGNGSGVPEFMAAGDPSANVEFLVNNDAAFSAFDPFGTIGNSVAVASSFNSGASFTNSDHIPGYVLRIPQGDRASVQAAGKWYNGIWTVEFKKPYAGSASDFAVVPGTSVKFSHETFDNQGGTHPNDGFDATVYELDFSIITDVKEVSNEELPTKFELSQNYPNPFNPSTKINFSVPNSGIVSLKVFNALGQEVATLINENLNAGKYTVDFNADNLSSGIYLYRLTVGNTVQTRKMILLK